MQAPSYTHLSTNHGNETHQRMERIIERGQKQAVNVLQAIENDVPQDQLTPACRLRFNFEGDKSTWIEVDGERKGIHDHALMQLCERTGLPKRYFNQLITSDWGRGLLTNNFDAIVAHQESTRYLVRSVRGEVRGLLSDKYRRLDNGPLVETFLRSAHEVGAVIAEGHVSDTRVAMRVVLPYVFEPAPGEFMIIGANWSNSDFGNGSNAISTYVLRLICDNGAMGQNVLKQVHLGARLPEGFQFSEETMLKDTAASQSAMTDVVKAALAPAAINRITQGIAAADEEITSFGLHRRSLERILGKKDMLNAENLFENDKSELLPTARKSTWRMSNVLSYLATQTDSTERRLDLQRAAGAILDKSLA